MKGKYKETGRKERLFQIFKFVICAFILLTVGKLLFADGIGSFYSFKDYSSKNEFVEEEAVSLNGVSRVTQTFTLSGNTINSLSLYTGNMGGKLLYIEVLDSDGNQIATSNIDTSKFKKNSWNELGIKCKNLKRHSDYTIAISSEEKIDGIFYGTGTAPEPYKECVSDGQNIEGHLLLGMSMTYRYIMLAKVFELCLKVIFSFLIALAMCIAVLKFEDVYGAFKVKDKKGISYALYYSVSLMLLYNPIAQIRTRVIDFKRIIGAGLNGNVDVSRRISNFNHWFIAFGISFALLFMLANYFLNKEKSSECKKLVDFLDSFMVLANCNLVLRCITYFKDSNSTANIFYFSQNVIMLLSFVLVAYVLLGIDRNISVDRYEQLMLAAICASVSLTVFIGKEFCSGRLLLGVMTILFAVLIVLCKYGGRLFESKDFEQLLPITTAIISCLPLMTSFYIELIHVLNRHEVFVAHPAKYYKIACILGFVAYVAVIIFSKNKKLSLKNWKSICFPVFIAGVSCLSVQIPISSTYNPDLFESANSSILMSDFLNFGDIPIVQHYGGHMMTGVWEGLLYAFLNKDYVGLVSPYQSLLTPMLILLFYYMLSRIWNKEMAIMVAVLFPYLNFFQYYGLGILVCLAAMAYVRKNTMGRAITLWGMFVWCALYRLDLGFAFGAATIITMLIYVIANKNIKASKQLGISLAGWGILGGISWFVICICKGVSPINRLIEFLMINLSNQNWAYGNIGNVDNTVFAFAYIIIPFAMALLLAYTVFSSGLRERIGVEKWILLLILNLSYFENYSRGLTRHSLAENATTIVFWSAYLFLALFIAFYKEDMRKFLPSFMLLILLNTLLTTQGNFTTLPLADSAVSRPEGIIESWKPTRFYEEDESIESEDGKTFKTKWEMLKYDRKVADRVELDKGFESYVDGFELVLDQLLDENETFVDFINKTVIYSAMGRRCPVYVSQSPLQLSGEFTQEEFIKEIVGVPVILMPVDNSNYRASNSLDGVTNAYRNYKVYEYICQNYRPLCQYGNDYAVWCLSDRYDNYKEKLAAIESKTEYVGKLLSAEGIVKGNISLESGSGGTVAAKYSGKDPMLINLQSCMDLTPYIDSKMQIEINYQTNVAGTMQMFYTSDENEEFAGEKVLNADIKDSGTAKFMIPVTEFTKLRLDTPEESTVSINSITTCAGVDYIDYGYDGPFSDTDASGNVSYSYISALHNSNVGFLPRIWAESDREKAIDNKVLADAVESDGYYTFDDSSFELGTNGNYLEISAIYDGSDTGGKFKSDDEVLGATLVFGDYTDGNFVEKYRFALNFDEGRHDYLVRCSTDYYWYLKQVNAVRIDTEGSLRDVSMQILEGD